MVIGQTRGRESFALAGKVLRRRLIRPTGLALGRVRPDSTSHTKTGHNPILLLKQSQQRNPSCGCLSPQCKEIPMPRNGY